MANQVTDIETPVNRKRSLLHNDTFLFVLLGFLGIALYAVLSVGSTGVWSDEAFSFGMTRLSFREIWNLPTVDVHPPLYYFYLKLVFMLFGENMISAQAASAVPAAFILLFGGWQLGKLCNKRVGLLFMAAYLAFTPMLMYAFEVRMYALAAAFVFADAIIAYRCFLLTKRMDWFWLAICSVGAAYTHYYAFLAVGLIDLALLVAVIRHERDRMKWWIGSFALMVLMYLPWCSNMLGQLMYKAENEYWIEPITIKTLGEYVFFTFKVERLYAFAAFLAAAYIILIVWAFKNRVKKALFLLLLPASVAGIGILVSSIVRPVLVFRYLVPALCMLPVFAALVLDKMFEASGKPRKLAVWVLLTLVVVGGINAGFVIGNELNVPENAFNKVWVEKQTCDEYVVTSSISHPSTVLACLEQHKPIYTTVIESGKANPFPNIRDFEQFVPTGNEHITLITDEGLTPPTKLEEAYACTFKGQIIESNNEHYDVYELKPRNSHPES